MKITVKFSGYDFFGQYDFIEASADLTTETAKKAIAGLKKNSNFTIHIFDKPANTTFTYDSYIDFENGIVSVIQSPQWNITEPAVKMSFAKAKKMIMEKAKETE